MTPEAARAEFEALFRTSEEPPLDRACALVAVEEGATATVEELLGTLDGFAAEVGLPSVGIDDGVELAVPLALSVARLHHVLFEVHGFTGDPVEYDRPENSLLDHVLASGRGLPILLSVVYLEVARRCGIPAAGVGFPGHFLVNPGTDPPIWVDPFHRGRILPRPALEARLTEIDRAVPSRDRVEAALAPVGPRYLLARIENNLKGSRLRRGDVVGALRATERLLVAAPELVEELRDRGLMRAHLGRIDAAIEDLRRYLLRRPDAPDRERIETRLAELEGPGVGEVS
jgi:regulator of sirC expression with transglutaminase-like and TPR domain